MIRLLLRLFRIRDFEVCASCETLKQQLAYERDEKRQLTETLLNIIQPKMLEAPVQELQPITHTAGLFSRRRSALEAKDREEAKIIRESKHLGKPDDRLNQIKPLEVNIKTVDELEKELGVEEEKNG